jgi:hypothetical protein
MGSDGRPRGLGEIGGAALRTRPGPELFTATFFRRDD